MSRASAPAGPPHVVLDAGGLIACERRHRELEVFLERARQARARLIVPTTALAQVVREPVRQVSLMRLVRGEHASLRPLTELDAIGVGRLLARTRTRDVVDAHVVICAQVPRALVVTSDPEDLLRLDPSLQLVVV